MTLEVTANVVYKGYLQKRKFKDEKCVFTAEKRMISEGATCRWLEIVLPLTD